MADHLTQHTRPSCEQTSIADNSLRVNDHACTGHPAEFGDKGILLHLDQRPQCLRFAEPCGAMTVRSIICCESVRWAVGCAGIDRGRGYASLLRVVPQIDRITRMTPIVLTDRVPV